MSDVLCEMRGDIALVTLNRPDKLNAVSQTLRAALIETLARLNHDPMVRAIVLTGAGSRAFCAGQDLEEAARVDIARIPAWLDAQRAMYQAVRDLDKPCIAALNGVAAGAGFQIALCADWRIAGIGTRIGQPEVKAGLASIVGSYLMTLHVGMTHNVQLSLSGDLIDARRAYEIGLVTELAEPTSVLDAALERARQLAKLPAHAIKLSKQRLRALTQAGFDAACAAGIEAQTQCYAHGEPQAAMRAFLNGKASTDSRA
ncbi:enoyl-CoA hydratase/isomerase family protein [Paraburkholderia sp. LEh10]|jgi:enoyl-CoA hydratase/carnithine racemase|uniref:enoyl-CoA hydratase/isomerase family protein n=1 Tax=Paraburkholderia sp. LEh10 TaxID=2821353 RepID=UPI001AEA0E14|nr:enoyl-CoA hydratase/isomerase family protein [Paraburkholderia sp. LEh10]MBP0588161.1 enoyl-CoA hydratase/isomerase family protein [Paraburkholderia sp. LEh10]